MTVTALDETAELIEAIATEPKEFTLSPLEFINVSKSAKKEQRVFEKYRALLKDMTREEELEIVGISLSQAFPPIERDVEKLVIDLNLVVYQYMQKRMEADKDIRVETIRSTVSSSLRKVSMALLTMMAEDK